jgi:hypothetical protein
MLHRGGVAADLSQKSLFERPYQALLKKHVLPKLKLAVVAHAMK